MRCKSISEFIMCFMLSLFSLTAFAQIKITGTASDAETGEPLSFITIQIKGTTAGTTSDMDGNYSIEVPNRDAILVYSYIGYRSQEIKVGNQTHINVRLSEDVETLDEVVVVGYGVQNKRDVTGSIAKVGSEELMSVPTSSFDAALQGRAAGVQVTQTSGLAGSGAAIRVRGIASITAGGDPLIVVDGIPIMQNAGDRVGAAQDNPMSSINANDIESIDILKDASATAIYGSRGANGVVLITTKRGKSGKPQINFSSKVAFSTTNRKVDMLETKDYLDIYKEALENDYKFNPSGATYPSTVSSYPGGYSEEQALLNNTDWQDLITRTGISTYNDLSVSWGNKKIQTYLGVSNVEENSYLVNDHFGRTSVRLNIDYKPINILKIGGNFSFSHTDHRPTPSSWDGGWGRAISTALPYFPAYNSDGSYYVFPKSTNPVTEANEKRRRIFTQRTMASLYADLQIIKGLSLRLEGNIDYRDNESNYLRTKELSTKPNSNVTNRYETNWNAKALLNYSLSINEKHRFHFLLGTEALKSTRVSNYTNVVFEQGKEDWLFNNPAYDETNKTFTSYPNQDFSFISFFGRINYTFKDRYMFTGTFRRDGSSRFGENNKFGNFPAASIGWMITEEDFLKDNEVVSLLKLKTGFGITGNAEIPNYAQWGAVSVNTNQLYVGDNYWYINSLKNPDLKWETTSQFNVGVDLSLFNNRLRMTADYYRKKTTDLLNNVEMPRSSGYTTALRNIGSIRNSGFELQLDGRIIDRAVKWDLGVNFSLNRSKVLVLSEDKDIFGGELDNTILKDQLNLMRVGEPMYVFYGYVEDGYDENGHIVYKNMDDDPAITAADKTIIGDPNPDFLVNLTTAVSYKGFTLSAFFQSSIGNDIYSLSMAAQAYDYGYNGNTLREVYYNHWTLENPTAKYPNLDQTSYKMSDRFVYDGSFVRLKNLELAYDVPCARNKFIKRARVYVSAQNLFTITSYPFWDPDINANGGGSSMIQGVDSYCYPSARTYTIGCRLTF